MTNLIKVADGSILDQSRKDRMGVEHSLANADVIVLLDSSGTMGNHDAADYQRRFDVACAKLLSLQSKYPSRLGVLAFSSVTQFFPGGIPSFLGGGTDLAGALEFVLPLDSPKITYFVISDGEPDSEEDAYEQAMKLKGKINTIFVGNQDNDRAIEFMKKLAAMHGGKSGEALLLSGFEEKFEELLMLGSGS